MKTLKIILIVAIICAQNCFAQETEELKINFFDFIRPSSDINIRDFRLSDKQTISYYSVGIDMYETNRNGIVTFFLIPKKEFGVWKKEDKSEWKREDLWENSQEKIRNAREFLSSPEDTLFTYFDLYVFYIKQEDIAFEGTVMSDDGVLLDDYYVKDNATVYTYTYENGIWIEKNRDRNIRSFGRNIVEKILQERFGEVI